MPLSLWGRGSTALVPCGKKVNGGHEFSVAWVSLDNGQLLGALNGTHSSFGSSMLVIAHPDGASLLLVASPEEGGWYSGTVRAFTSQSEVAWTRTGTEDSGRFGSLMRAIPDLDGDGWPEVAVAAPGWLGTNAVGRVYVVSGLGGGVLRSYSSARQE